MNNTSNQQGLCWIKPEDLEALLERGVRVYGPSSSVRPANWNEQPGLQDTHTALVIGATPIRKPRTRELSEDAVREALTNDVWDVGNNFSDRIIARLFGQGAGGG